MDRIFSAKCFGSSIFWACRIKVITGDYICIEIDGEQHERFQEQKLRDIEKDKLLKEEGWKELRKSWQDIFNNPKSFIEEVKNIIGQ